MFSQVWKKYLPVIVILMKRSVSGEQTFSMNPSDFQRAAGGRKIKYSFSNLQLTNGRINNMVKHLPLARELAEAMLEDEIIRKFLQKKNFEFSMNSSFQLNIINSTPPAEPLTAEENGEAVKSDDEVSLTETDA